MGLTQHGGDGVVVVVVVDLCWAAFICIIGGGLVRIPQVPHIHFQPA